jgi:hypothetical protein
MKKFEIIFCILGFLSSCCGSNDGGSVAPTAKLYSRTINLLDTTDRILMISYKDYGKIFLPKDTSCELVISENTVNTLYIKTRNANDTIVLNVGVDYQMGSENCGALNTVKTIQKSPKILKHSFKNAYFIQKYDDKSLTSILYIEP